VCSGSEEHTLNFFEWITLTFALLVALAGGMVLRGVFLGTLSSRATVRFLRLSLVASLAGLMPLTRHLTPVQPICILSVYCSAHPTLAAIPHGPTPAIHQSGIYSRSRSNNCW